MTDQPDHTLPGIDPKLVDELVARCREDGVILTDHAGVAALQAAMDDPTPANPSAVGPARPGRYVRTMAAAVWGDRRRILTDQPAAPAPLTVMPASPAGAIEVTR